MAGFGSLGAISTLLPSSSRISYFGLFLFLSVFIINTIIFFRKHATAPCLFWSQYCWLVLGSTVGVLMALSLEALFGLSGNRLLTGIFAGIIMLYGISFVVIAYLKPSLRQQVNESVRIILRAAPGKQMVLADLIAYLQTEYTCSEALLTQYIEQLSYVETMTIPATAIRICRIKGTNETVAFPQAQSIAS